MSTASDRPRMRFAVDGWDPSYGSSLDTEEENLTQSTATIAADVEMRTGDWRPLDVSVDCEPPGATLFVDGVRRIEARVWIDGDGSGAPAGPGGGADQGGPEASVALCASYAAGVVCCSGGRAHLAGTRLRRGLFTVAPRATDIVTRAGRYQAFPVSATMSKPLIMGLTDALQRRLGEIEMATAAEARSALADHPHDAVKPDDDLLVVDGPVRGRQHLPRTIGFIKSHRKTYLSPDLNAVVGALAPGQRTPVFGMGTTWDRYTWYLRLPGPAGAPWAGVVRVECAADLSMAEVIRLANVSQGCLGRFASAAYKDSRAPQNLYPIGGLERELRHRLGDPKLLYRALRQAAGAR